MLSISLTAQELSIIPFFLFPMPHKATSSAANAFVPLTFWLFVFVGLTNCRIQSLNSEYNLPLGYKLRSFKEKAALIAQFWTVIWSQIDSHLFSSKTKCKTSVLILPVGWNLQFLSREEIKNNKTRAETLIIPNPFCLRLPRDVWSYGWTKQCSVVMKWNPLG